MLSAFLFFNLVEYQFHSSSIIRGLLFFTYIIICMVVLYKWLFIHLVKLVNKKNQISDELAAKNIGLYFPDIQDKLLNLIQLTKVEEKNRLLSATIKQRSGQMQLVSFEEVIHLKENTKYLKFLIFPFFVVAFLGVFSPSIILEPTKRIIQFNKEFIPSAPFEFAVQNKSLMAFRNEDFKLDLQISGSEIPESVYLITDNRRIKLEKTGIRNYSYNFEKIQESKVFNFEAVGFSSNKYNVDVVNRPNIKNFTVSLIYPSYLHKQPESLENIGGFQIPLGTKASWFFRTSDVNDISLKFEGNDAIEKAQSIDNQVFEYSKSFFQSETYSINLKNSYSENKEAILYTVEVIPDEFPKINLDQLRDTVLFQYIIFGGNISDDYGINDLALNYRKFKDKIEPDQAFNTIKINIDKSKNSQSFYYHWQLNDFQLQKGEKLEYYMTVRDNDGINTPKTTNTARYTFEIPTAKKLKQDFKLSSENSENTIDKSIEEAKELNKELEEIDNKLKGKKELTWQDQKQIEDLIKRKQEQDEAIKQFREQFEAESKKRERFDDKLSEEIKEKLDQLQKLMDELLDDETKKLYQELQKLLEDQKNIDELKNVLEKIHNRESNLQKELERTLELFKKMKFEFKLDESIKHIKELQEKQNEAGKNSEDKSMDQESLLNQQKELNEEFQDLKNELGEMQQLNQDLQRPEPMQDISEEEKSIENQQKEATKNLEQKNNNKAGKAQQGASDQMKKLADKLQSMQSMMMQSSMSMNLNQLRDILDNLIKLSFAQEKIMNDFRAVQQSDPRFLELSQQQLKIKDDAKVIQDSLISLSKEDFRIQSIVTRKVDEMNQYLDETVEAIKERNKAEAVGKQQFSMTTINDLALMLDDVMSQMMDAMGKGGGQPQNSRVPSMSELQQQLGEKINELKKSGKSGRQLSEELAKMAEEQERIRQMLGEMEEDMKKGNSGNEGQSLKEIKEKMEQNELDLVNKRLTDQLIQRQKEIMTRLLEAENAQKERELDDEREAERSQKIEKSIPGEFEEYIKAKEKEIELLKTVPLKLNPYYKKEVNEYFKRLGS